MTATSDPAATVTADPAVRAPQDQPGQPDRPVTARLQAGPGQAEELLIEEISIDGMCGVY